MIILGLGTNFGDRLVHLRKAVQLLEAGGAFRIHSISPLYESEAMLPEKAPEDYNQPFLNLALTGETTLEPLALLRVLHDIEKAVGRTSRGKWGPREIDIDILAWDQKILKSEALSIPHQGLLERPFALLPVADIAPAWVEPQTGKTADELAFRWQKLPVQQVPFQTHRSMQRLSEFVAILNLTPDSFSDGGAWMDPELALQHARHLIQNGAGIIDIGGESTRPQATPLSPDEEWKRLHPVLEGLRAEFATLPRLSVDTRNAAVAKKALSFGVDWINDVTGGSDPALRRVVADSSADFVVMHSLTVPPSRDARLNEEEDPVEQLLIWADKRFSELEDAGIPRSRLIFDPGIGFGKNPFQSVQLLRGIRRFRELGTRILVGHSRKSFFAQWSEQPANERDIETCATSQLLLRHGVDYLRVHNIAMHERMACIHQVLDGIVHRRVEKTR